MLLFLLIRFIWVPDTDNSVNSELSNKNKGKNSAKFLHFFFHISFEGIIEIIQILGWGKN